jgi:hypothetical protein
VEVTILQDLIGLMPPCLQLAWGTTKSSTRTILNRNASLSMPESSLTISAKFHF